MNDVDRPQAVGWYVTWLPRQDTVGEKPLVTYCYPEDTDIYCECRDGREPAFRPVSHEFFHGAKWRGPYPSRRAAEDALAA